jgi:hypothetical protein
MSNTDKRGDEEFFHRRVLSRVLVDGVEEIELECGHHIVLINPSAHKEPAMFCAGCVQEFVEAERAKEATREY